MSKPGWTPQPKKDAGIVAKAEYAGPAIDEIRRETTDYRARNEQPTNPRPRTGLAGNTYVQPSATGYITSAAATYCGETITLDVGPGEEVHIAVNFVAQLVNVTGAAGYLALIYLRLARSTDPRGTKLTAANAIPLAVGSQDCLVSAAASGHNVSVCLVGVDTPAPGSHTYNLVVDQETTDTKTQILQQYWYVTKRIAKVGR